MLPPKRFNFWGASIHCVAKGHDPQHSDDLAVNVPQKLEEPSEEHV